MLPDCNRDGRCATVAITIGNLTLHFCGLHWWSKAVQDEVGTVVHRASVLILSQMTEGRLEEEECITSSDAAKEETPESVLGYQ